MSASSYEFEGFRLDAVRRQLQHPSGNFLDVPARAFDVLVFLIEQRNEVVSKERLMKAVWPKSVVEENNLTQAISALRRVLGEDKSEPRFVMTVPGRGYRFIARASPLPDDSGPRHAGRNVNEASAPGAGYASERIDSIAVLPFKSLTPGTGHPALELGMTDTLISELSALPQVRVSPLGTVRRYSPADQDPIRAGHELNVSAVLEGSLQTHGDRLRVTARLLRIQDGQSLWTGRFDESLSDVFAIQDSIAARVTEALRPTLGAAHASTRKPTARQTHNLGAYQFYIAGLFNELRRDIDGLPAAVENYQAAIQADPQYVRAWAGLSVALAVQAVFGRQPPMAVFPRAKEAALHAVRLDSNSPEALGALGHVLVQFEQKFAEGQQHYHRARELAPDNAHLLLWISINYAHQGQLEKAVAEIRRAIEIEPKTLAYSAVHGMLLYYQRELDEAIAHLQHLIDIEPQFDQARTFLGKAWLRKNRPDRALEQFKARIRSAPGSFGDLACAYAQAGRVSDARREIDKLHKLAQDGFGMGYDLALVHAELGDVPAALRALEHALQDHSQLIGFLQVDPALDALRSEPRYADIARRLYGK